MKKGTDCRFHTLRLAALLLAGAQIAAAAEPEAPVWRSLPAAELAMTAEPAAPGAPAVYLYTQIDRNDISGWEKQYRQVKVLTDEGRNRANISIQYRRDLEAIEELTARVVQPDGTIVPFKGTVYDTVLAALGKEGVNEKNLALPDVRVGSVIEYRYKRNFTNPNFTFASHWLLSEDLFTRLGHYSLRPDQNLRMRMIAPRGWPSGERPQTKDKVLELETRNTPAFVTEDFMPPVANLQYRVDFIYIGPNVMSDTDPVRFWSNFGKGSYKNMQKFSEVTGKLKKTLAGIIAAGDSDADKVRKIYAHVQQLRNVTFERTPDSKEAKAARTALTRNVTDVAENGSGDRLQLALYFIALVRAAGIAAEPAMVAGRAERIFASATMNPEQLNSVVAAVTVDGKELLLDPGVSLLPYGGMAWFNTATDALKLNEAGGQWFRTPNPVATDAVTRRVARLTLSADGVLDGTVAITYSGHEAFSRRLQVFKQDEVARKEFLETELKTHLPKGAVVQLLEQPDWDGKGTPLEVKYQVTVSDWAVVTGGRLLVGFGLFGAAEKGVFIPNERQHPIYFNHPFIAEDALHIQLPAGYRVDTASLPKSTPQTGQLRYAIAVEQDGGTVVLRRNMAVEVLMANPNVYPRLQSFFQDVRAGDERQIVLAK